VNANQQALLAKARRSVAAGRRLMADGDLAFGQEFAKGDPALREFHHGMAEAQDARNAGDYQIDLILSAEDVQVHLDRADQFIRAAAEML